MSVRADVDRGLQIVGQMAMLEKELDEIEERLEKAGLEGEQVELVDPEREGRQYLARGSESVVPVVFTADLLVKSFQEDSAVDARISAALGCSANLMRRFFKRVVKWETIFDSGKQFRAAAAEILGKTAPDFISACLQRDKHGIPKSQTKIDWSRAEKIATQSQSEAAA